MSTPSSTVDVMPVKSTAFPAGAGAASGRTAFNIRHELVDAQVEVLRMYLEKKSSAALLEALDRLIECAQVSFREEEALMEFLASTPDPRHRDMHHQVLEQMASLRRDVMEFDRGRLLAQLILVDRQLISHISDAAGVQDRQSLAGPAEHKTKPA